MDNDKKDMVTISIMFPVESDEKAIEIKKQIADVTTSIPNLRISFNMMSTKTDMPTG